MARRELVAVVEFLSRTEEDRLPKRLEMKQKRGTTDGFDSDY